MTTEERIKMKENILAISEWCKNNCDASPVTIRNVVYANRHNYSITICKEYGISARSDARFASELRAYEGYHEDNLCSSSAGYEIVYDWQNIKAKIIAAVRDAAEKRKYTMGFTV